MSCGLPHTTGVVFPLSVWRFRPPRRSLFLTWRFRMFTKVFLAAFSILWFASFVLGRSKSDPRSEMLRESKRLQSSAPKTSPTPSQSAVGSSLVHVAAVAAPTRGSAIEATDGDGAVEGEIEPPSFGSTSTNHDAFGFSMPLPAHFIPARQNDAINVDKLTPLYPFGVDSTFTSTPAESPKVALTGRPASAVGWYPSRAR